MGKYKIIERSIAYAGRNLSPTEQAYSATEREALAVIGRIKKFQPYLYGQRFTVHTDHHALRWLMNIKDVTAYWPFSPLVFIHAAVRF